VCFAVSWRAPVVMNMVVEISNSIRMGRAARFPVSPSSYREAFPAAACAAAGAFLVQVGGLGCFQNKRGH